MEDGATAVTKLLYLRGFYAFYFSSMMLRLVYSPVYFKQLGLSSTYTGILNGAGPFINAFGGLLFCYIADKTNKSKIIFLVSLLACVANPLLLTFPQTPCLEAGHAKGIPNVANSERKLHEGIAGNGRKIVVMKSRNSNSQTSDLGHNQLGAKSRRLQNTEDAIRKKEYGRTSRTHYPKTIHSSLLEDSITVKTRRPEFLNKTGSSFPSWNAKLRLTKTPFNSELRPKTRNRYQHKSILHAKWNVKDIKKQHLVPNKETQRKNDQRHFIANKRVKKAAFSPTKLGEVRQEVSNNKSSDGDSVNDGDVDNDKTTLFLLLLAIVVVGQFVSSPSRGLADTATMFYLQNNKADYGKIRLWGNVGQCLIIPSVSLLVYFQKTSVCGAQQDNYKMAMYILSGGLAIALLIGFKFIFPSTNLTGHQAETSKEQGTVSELVAPFRIWSFLIIVFFLGTFEGVFNTFMFWFIVDLNANQSALIIAVATFLRNVTAFVTFAASPTVLKKFGAINAINIALVLYCASFLVYSLITNPWIAIIPEVVQYVSFSLSMAASVTYMGEISPDNLAATAQGIIMNLLFS